MSKTRGPAQPLTEGYQPRGYQPPASGANGAAHSPPPSGGSSAVKPQAVAQPIQQPSQK